MRVTKHLETFYCRNEGSFYCATFRYEFVMKYVSFDLRIKSGTAHIKRELLERYLVLQTRNTSNIVFQALKKRTRLTQKYEVQYTGYMPRS